jgi:hypothetical protein
MRSRLEQSSGLIILVGALSLFGCATPTPTTSQWAISKGFQPVDLKGDQYYCRAEPTSPPSDKSNVNCLTVNQLVNDRTASESRQETMALTHGLWQSGIPGQLPPLGPNSRNSREAASRNPTLANVSRGSQVGPGLDRVLKGPVVVPGSEVPRAAKRLNRRLEFALRREVLQHAVC